MPKKDDRDILTENMDDTEQFQTGLNPNRETNTHNLNNAIEQKTCCSDFRFTPLNIIYGSILVAVVCITIALLINIMLGSSQLIPHGYSVSDEQFCAKESKFIMSALYGNAVDGIISSILCLTVTRPDIASLGGCASFLIHKRDDNINNLFDAMCSAPKADVVVDPSKPHTTVGIPGLLAGLKEMHDKFGYLNWNKLFVPALKAAKDGFKIHPSLLENAQTAISSNPQRGGDIAKQLVNWAKLHPDQNYPGRSELEQTLRDLASSGSHSLYAGWIGQALVDEMTANNVTWNLKSDMINYRVNRPKPVNLGLAGFNLEGFPAPFVGGSLATSVLGNLDLLNHIRPLNAKKLAKGDVEEVAIVYHRLIELEKFAISQISWLGDPKDPVIGTDAVTAEDAIFSFDARKKLVDSINDNSILDASAYGQFVTNTSVSDDIGNSFALTVESDMLIVSVNLIMGSPFGSGMLIPGTGINLNSALSLFSDPLSIGQNSKKKLLNILSSGRRPLVATSPVFFNNALQKCGHRFVTDSNNGLSGVIQSMHVIASSALYMSKISCPANDTLPIASTPSSSETTADYNPAIGSCLPIADALALKRFYPRVQLNSNQVLFDVVLESGFSSSVQAALERKGHKIVSSHSTTWRGQVGAVGWTWYDVKAAVDPRMNVTTEHF